ncbi:MAG: DNA mismatch repair protein MutS [Desulfobacterales bacterium]|nr:DNA mismatch repair protein MutS [Desulfobacterales bacterium]
MSPPKLTPMLKQYLSIKEAYPDTILFYRMGDFYEMFFEDAQVASRVLDITLTSRNKKDESPVPMCGVPHRAVSGYIARMIDHGYKVAVCDQIEDPASAKGLVKRDVVRVITPGMIIDDAFLDKRSHNFVMALSRHGGNFGLSYLDISTGLFRLVESDDQAAIVDESLRLSAREILLAESVKNDPYMATVRTAQMDRALTYLEDRAFDTKRCYNRLTEQFKTISLEGFGCEGMSAGIQAAGALVFYVRETQKQTIEHLTHLETYSLGHYLLVDDASCRNLELEKNLHTNKRRGTLMGVIDHTRSAMGARLLKTWLRYPLIDINDIRARHQAVAEAKENIHSRQSLRDLLKSVFDIERVSTKIVMGHANARDLIALKRSLMTLPHIHTLVSKLASALFSWDDNLNPLYQLSDLIEKAIREDAPPTTSEGGMIKAGYDDALDELVKISQDGKGWLANLEIQERKATGITALKVRYNKVFGYYIEVPKSRSSEVPANYVRKQTLVNAERYITDELKTFETKVINAEDQRAALELEIFNQIRQEVVQQYKHLESAAQFLARLDCLLNLAEVADQNDYCQPEMTLDGLIDIEDGRHPVIEKMITAERFVPNTVSLDNETNQILLITGPNMAGKSTVLRQVALLVIMAQMGSFIPARKATIGVVDRIFTRVGALDNLSHGQSTFMVEMQETANILNNAGERSLIIMDEIGRGTSTYDGLSIAWAVVEYLHDLHKTGVKTLFATHYHELTELAQQKPRVKNYNIAVKEWNDEIIFLRKLVEGATNRSYGIQVARLAGIPEKVINRSKKILYRIENQEQEMADSFSDLKEPSQGSVQMDLFHHKKNWFVDKLAKVDIGKMTPLEALNYLNELQQKAKDVAE